MQWFLVVLIWFSLIINICESTRSKRVKRIVGGINALTPPPDAAVIFTRLYGRNSRIEGIRDKITGLYSFLGIRYAESPEGEERFLRPKYKSLKGDINATQYGPPCAQPHHRNPSIIIGSEDCLLLNVFTPQMPDETTGLPVLMFIHGGGFRYGSANQYGPIPLTSKRVIFVPIQYRLGTLGIIGDGSKEFSGNVALFDMLAALRWINEYISFFGGDPNQVTVIGHGSGATSASYLSMSDISEGMVNGVVAMSGSPLTKYAFDEQPVQSVKEIASIHRCDSNKEIEIITCLRKKDIVEIIRDDSKVQTARLQGRAMIKAMTGMAGFNPAMEKSFDNRGLPGILDRNPQEKLNQGKFPKIPLLTGVTMHETGNAQFFKDIDNVFGSASNFLKSLTNNLQIPFLFSNDSMFGNITNVRAKMLLANNPTLSLSKYIDIPESMEPEKIIKKIAEITTDVLFNLPAVFTAQLWNAVAPSFLYSFEYLGHTSKGSNFLSGLPIVNISNSDDSSVIGHGDELGYLFDARDVYGNIIESSKLTNSSDKKVQDHFTNLVANFVHSVVNRNDMNTSSATETIFSSITKLGGRTSFIKIDTSISIDNDFRFCQLSVIGANLPSTKPISCEFLLNQLKNLNAATKDLTPIQLSNKLRDEKLKILSPSILEDAPEKSTKDLTHIEISNKLQDEKSKILTSNILEDAGEINDMPKNIGLKKTSLNLF